MKIKLLCCLIGLMAFYSCHSSSSMERQNERNNQIKRQSEEMRRQAERQWEGMSAVQTFVADEVLLDNSVNFFAYQA